MSSPPQNLRPLYAAHEVCRSAELKIFLPKVLLGEVEPQS